MHLSSCGSRSEWVCVAKLLWRRRESVAVNRTWNALLEELVQVQRGGPRVGLLGSRWRGGRLLCFLHRILKRRAGVGPGGDVMWGRQNNKYNEAKEQRWTSEYFLISLLSFSPRSSFHPHLWVQVLRRLCEEGYVKWAKALGQTFGLVWVGINENQWLPCGTINCHFTWVKWLNAPEHCSVLTEYCRLLNLGFFFMLQFQFNNLFFFFLPSIFATCSVYVEE